jgi:uncharacterized membrane protein
MAPKKTKSTPERNGHNGSIEELEKELKNNVEKIVAIEREHKEAQTRGEKLSELIAAFCGSTIFVYINAVWFGGWIIANSIMSEPFDPFPFTFLTLVVSLEAIFLSIFILISQNNQTRLTERRNHLDLQINILSEQENTKMLELLQLIADKVGVDSDDSSTAALLTPVEPVKVVEHIVAASEEKQQKQENDEKAF